MARTNPFNQLAVDNDVVTYKKDLTSEIAQMIESSVIYLEMTVGPDLGNTESDIRLEGMTLVVETKEIGK